MNHPSPAALVAAFPLPGLPLDDWQLLALALLALVASGFCAMLRSTLLHSVPSRVLEQVQHEERRSRLAPMLERAESLATSASVLEHCAQIIFIFLVLTAWKDMSSLAALGLTVFVTVPVLVFVSDLLPNGLRSLESDAWLCRVLPGFEFVQRPVALLTALLEGTRRFLMRVMGIQEPQRAARQLMEGLRYVFEDSARSDEFKDAEREIIENVVDFYNLDVAEIMTPRTELAAVNVNDGVGAAVELFTQSGHSRLPVFEKSLDTIIGIAYAQELIGKVRNRNLKEMELRPLLQPVGFVPETKLVSELLNDFRKERLKMAVVLDEYGGTAGVITLGDIVEELVGGMREELGDPAPAMIVRLEDGSIKIEANMRICEINEFLEDELEVELPEEADYETLAGFVLSEMGRFPKPGEYFEWNQMRFSILEANDRRVLRVLLSMPQAV